MQCIPVLELARSLEYSNWATRLHTDRQTSLSSYNNHPMLGSVYLYNTSHLNMNYDSAKHRETSSNCILCRSTCCMYRTHPLPGLRQ